MSDAHYFDGSNWKILNPTEHPNPDFCFKLYGINHVPEKPITPEGPTSGDSGVQYTFSTSTTDEDNHQIYYMWDWGDGNFSDWIGPKLSGQTIYTQYGWGDKSRAKSIFRPLWLESGTYQIRVKAKDTLNAESEWSDPLVITITKDKKSDYPLLEKILKNHPIILQWVILMLESLDTK